MKLPPLAETIAQRMLSRLDEAKHLTPSELKKYQLLKSGDPAPIAERVAELNAKRALTPGELKELKELQDALGEIKSTGWKPKTPTKTGAGGFIDRMQSGLDVATTAAGVGSMAAAATGVGAVPGAVVNVASNVADLLNAGVDLVQAGVAAAQGDFAGAGAQLKDAGMRGIAAVPIIGDSLKAGGMAAKVVGKGGGAVAKNADELFGAARKADIHFPELRVSGPSHSRQFAAAGKQTVIRAEELIGNNAAGIGNTTARMFEDVLYKKLKADPALAKDPNAFQEAYSAALGRLKRLDQLRPPNGNLTEAGAQEAAKRWADAVAELKGLPVEAGSAHAQMISSLEKGRDAVMSMAETWKPGLKSIQLSAPRGAIFDWLR
ncbi:MAG: hypothetical protein JNK82_07855 [Myxococcaceae bacterium]|nr:hypothetical protein [Myxococcaceae bacterium]